MGVLSVIVAWEGLIFQHNASYEVRVPYDKIISWTIETSASAEENFVDITMDGTFDQRHDLVFDDGDISFQCVYNRKHEVVAYRTVGAKYYIAAGVDATHVIALTAMQDLFKLRPTKAQARA